ncbi:MAG: tRNA (N(6)-L-threonylcarbamoyladenosine(37)-C(2))-methylthiotransferase [Candidatus Micrarchaeales archaeon]|nr:tRNA (N(6)-L-threonylcarbamoyladenosine(37)-C(2))-methylthiotransferase [Candidatus Micrarchaeales archaeon]
MPVHIKTYGCTLNQADSELMAGLLTDSGVSLASENRSEVVVVNTCTVKTPTQQKILHKIKELESKGKNVVVTGCLASANQALIEKYAPKASIVTTSNIGSITRAVQETILGKKVVINSYSRQDKLALFNGNDSVIAKVPISEGCLSSCSFCETKSARGPLNSFSEDLIVNAVAMSARGGAKEVQITSQDTGAYGLDRRTNIARLMKRLSSIDGNFRIRIGMLNPEHLPKYLDAFIESLQNERFYRFVHIPIQSGSNIVLSAMKRMYTVEQFNSYVDALRQKLTDVTIETDIIVGFPTETDSGFEETLDFVRKTKPNVVNMCRFWARPHAGASKMEQLSTNLIAERSAELGRVVRRVQQDINDAFIGREVDVFVTEREEKSMNCRTDSYKKVIIRERDTNENVFIGNKIRVRIENASCNVLYGRPIG